MTENRKEVSPEIMTEITEKTDKMKILLVAPVPPPYGGIANWVALMRSYIQDHRSDIDLSIINIAPKKRMMDGRTLWDRVVGSGLDMLRKRRELLRLCRTDKPDVIHMTTSGRLALIRDKLLLKVARKYDVPVVYHIHFGRIAQISENKTREWRWMNKNIRLASAIISIDDSTYMALKSCCPQAKIVNIPNPVALKSLPAPEAFSPERKRIVYLGWVVPSKGMEELFTAWDTLASAYPDWSLQVIGPYDASYIEELKSRHSLERIELTGEQDHDSAMEMVKTCGLFVLPSYTEGFPNVIEEAMALARPIVATAVGAIPDMLADDCGVVIPPRDAESLRAALEGLMNHDEEREKMGQLAYEKAARTYDLPIVFEEYAAVWKSK